MGCPGKKNIIGKNKSCRVKQKACRQHWLFFMKIQKEESAGVSFGLTFEPGGSI